MCLRTLNDELLEALQIHVLYSKIFTVNLNTYDGLSLTIHNVYKCQGKGK